MQISIAQPDDWHIHFRDGDYLNRTVLDCARVFHRALVMPNLVPAIDTVAKADAYRQRILSAIPKGSNFVPLHSLYLTPETTNETVLEAKKSDFVLGFKLYPQGATTHSDQGVAKIETLFPIFAAMEEQQLVLQIHGEVTDADIDIFDRETRFLEKSLATILQHFPRLKIILEHITTRNAVNFVMNAGPQLAATITPHHLLFNRNDMLAGGIRPHLYCLPILKCESDRQALIAAAISGNPKFFLGSDSAPHVRSRKETLCGCAGIYSGHAVLEFYTDVFEQNNALDRLEAFSSFFGADFYQLPRNTRKIILKKESWPVPESLFFGPEQLVPLRAGENISWRVDL